MVPTRISGADPKPIGAPADWNDDQNGRCAGLFVRQEEQQGIAFMCSAWEATPAEALAQLAGGKVKLCISAPQHPVVNLGVDVPPEINPAMAVRFLVDSAGQPYVRVDAIYPATPPRSFYATILQMGRAVPVLVAEAVTAIEDIARREGVIE